MTVNVLELQMFRVDLWIAKDIEGIKQNLRFTKQESVNSTRNALRLAREAEETARNTLTRLGDQSGMCVLCLYFNKTYTLRRKTCQYGTSP